MVGILRLFPRVLPVLRRRGFGLGPAAGSLQEGLGDGGSICPPRPRGDEYDGLSRPDREDVVVWVRIPLRLKNVTGRRRRDVRQRSELACSTETRLKNHFVMVYCNT